MVGLTFCCKFDWSSYVISIAKIASKKVGALIRSMKFLSPEVSLYCMPMYGMQLSCLGWYPLVATWNC